MTSAFAFQDCADLVRRVLDTDYFVETAERPPPIPAKFVPGGSNLTVVVGPNASGKSFFRRVVQSWCRKAGVESMTISMEGRGPLTYGFARLCIYGDEQHEATGVNSIRTVMTGIKTCRERDTPHVIVWDEPDLGLSDGNAASIGAAIADFANKAPDLTLAILVVTHRRALVEQLRSARPGYLHLGLQDAPATLQDWLDEPIRVRPLQDIVDESKQRWRAIQDVLIANGLAK